MCSGLFCGGRLSSLLTHSQSVGVVTCQTVFFGFLFMICQIRSGKRQIGRWWHHCDTEFLKVVGSSWADPSELEPLKLKKYQSCPADPPDWHVILSFLTNDVKPFLFSSGGGEIACCPVTDKVEEDKQRWTTLHGNSANYQTDGWIIFGKSFW